MFGRKKKKSFFEKLTGGVPADDFDQKVLDQEIEDELEEEMYQDEEEVESNEESESSLEMLDDDSGDGQLSVDVMNNEDSIVIRAMVAGVKPGEIDVDISRDMVTIRGSREDTYEIRDEDYYHKELYWGSFSRNILLPEEIDVEESEAVEKHGLLTLTLPKLDKNKKSKLHVKSR